MTRRSPADDVDDDVLLAAVRRAPRPAPTAAETAAGARALEVALAADLAARRRAVSPLAVAAGLMLAAVAASAGTLLSLRALSPSTDTPSTRSDAPLSNHGAELGVLDDEQASTDTPSTDAPSTSAASSSSTPAPATASADEPVSAPVAPVPPTKARPSTSKKAQTWQEQADHLAGAGDVRAAAVLAARALVGNNDRDARAAQVLLWGLVGRDPAVVDVLDAAVTDVDVDAVGRALRLSCELRLRYARDATAVTTCRTFGQRFPSHPAARPLAFGAGGLAEELGDLRGAVDEYSRAVVLAPLSGSMASEALFARARVRARLGDLDEARADLRLFLRADPRPLDAHSDEVQGLARALRL